MAYSHRTLAACLLTAALLLSRAPAASAQVVVSQIYGAGGFNVSSVYTHDYIELFNRGSTSVNLSNWSVQYADAASTTWTKVDLTGSIPAGGYYLIHGQSNGPDGLPLPTRDCVNILSANMNVSAGKIALVTNQTPLPAQYCFPPGTYGIVDMVGYGPPQIVGSPCFEGNNTTSNPTTNLAAYRNGGGCTDNNTNRLDFFTSFPSARNTATGGTNVCVPATGACCVPASATTSQVCTYTSSADCAALGGTYSGNGSVCAPGSYAAAVSPNTFEDIAAVGDLYPGTMGERFYTQDIVTPPFPTWLTLPFTFYYHGQAKTECRINANGFLLLSPNPSTLPASFVNDNLPFPSAGGPNDMIAPYWDNLDFGTSGRLYRATLGTEPNRRYIVQWSNVATVGTALLNTFQVAFYEGTNQIEFRYLSVAAQGGGGGAVSFTAGIEDLSGTIGLDVSAGAVSGASIRFTPGGTCRDTGSCCHANTCSIVDATGCLGSGGAFNGYGSTCAANPCGAPVGRCCVAGGCSVVSAAACASGQWVAGGSCEPNPCVAQCCIEGVCALLTQFDCANAAGVWTNNGGTCSPDPCPGRCCTGTSCTVIAAGQCAGTFTVGGVCDSNWCALPCCDTTTHACTLVAVGGACSGSAGAPGQTCSAHCAPANDACSNAIPVMLGTPVVGYNNSATSEPTGTCFTQAGAVVGGAPAAGVWYTFTAPATHRYQVSTCGAETDFAPRLLVYTSADCFNFRCAGSNRTSAPGCTVAGSAAFCAEAGTQYHLLVGSDSSATGRFVLTVTDLGDVCPPNDFCESAIPIQPGMSIAGDNLFAASDSNPVSGTSCNGLGSFYQGVWYTFTDTSATPLRLRLDLCDPATDFDAALFVYSSTGGCAGPFTCVWANNTSPLGCPTQSASQSVAGGTTHSRIPAILNWTPQVAGDPVVTRCTTVTFADPPANTVVLPTTYYILVTSASTGATGHFVLHFEDTGESCNGTAPSHNGCAGARAITSFPFWDDVYPYDAHDTAPGSTCDGSSGDSRNGLWYVFTPAQSGDFFYTKIPDETATGTADDSVLSIFTSASACSGLAESACTSSADGYLTLFTNQAAHLSAGVQYYIQVSTFSPMVTPAQAWNIGFNFVPGAGAGACCRGSSCVMAGQSACTGPQTRYAGDGTVCNPPGNFTSPCCKADYNQSGAVSVQDIFDFLTGYFTGNPFADVNGNGAVSVQDIFDFLTSYFNGC